MTLECEMLMRICGTCKYANPKLNSSETEFLRTKVNFHQRYVTGLVLSRQGRASNISAEKKVSCQRENIRVFTLEDACAFWTGDHSPPEQTYRLR